MKKYEYLNEKLDSFRNPTININEKVIDLNVQGLATYEPFNALEARAVKYHPEDGEGHFTWVYEEEADRFALYAYSVSAERWVWFVDFKEKLQLFEFVDMLKIFSSYSIPFTNKIL